ncbi:MAG: hypothetical protein H7Z41_12030 [Cytophagales bacterium]|nr:hypothetical protein [Armatimonadota bacterium]
MVDEEGRPSANLLIGGGVLLAVVLVALFFTVASRPDHVAAPKVFKPYTAADRSFVCVAPGGWGRRVSSAQGIESRVLFQKGDAKIDIASDLMGSLMGDMARASDAQMEGMWEQMPPEVRARIGGGAQAARAKPPVEQIHLQSQKSLSMRFERYRELPMQTISSPIGEARCSEWTGEKDGLVSGGTFHGYRVTILGNDRRVTYTCQCPENSWTVLRPTFARVLASLATAPNS